MFQLNLTPPYTRRTFLQRLTLGGAALWIGSARGAAQTQPELAPALPGGRKLGVALVGLGSYSTGELAPALEKTKLCRLAGVVTGDRGKGLSWARKYQFPETSVYDYDTIERIADNRDIDIIYVVTPPGRHRDHVLAAVRARKHIICEKPMANSVAECDEMIRACREAGLKLSIGYRLQFEPHHREIDRLAREKEFGAFTRLQGENGFRLNRRVWRVDKQLAGGGPLMDVGIYVIQAACRAAAALPVAVRAHEEPKKNPELFNEVEEALRWTMEFPGGASCEALTSYAESMNRFRAEGSDGWIELAPAYGYRGIKGRTSRGALDFPQVPQQTLQMDDFATCVLTGRESAVAGELGRQHMAVIEAIYEAARTGQRVAVRA